MNEPEIRLKTRHSFTDFLYWNLALSVPIITACVAIIRNSVWGFILYVIVGLGLVMVIYRFYCTHCPHYIQGKGATRCMFFWGIPKIFEAKPGPLSMFERIVSLTAPVIMILLPLYWLVLEPALLVVYVLSMTVFIMTVRRNECGRCIYYDCPVNCVPESARERSMEEPVETDRVI